MFAIVSKTWIKVSKCFLVSFKEDSARRTIDHVRFACNNFTHDGLWVSFSLKHANNQIVHNHLGIVGMIIPLRNCSTLISLQAIATIEEFTNVSARVDLQNEFATWVVVNEFSDINDHVI